jgi:hypothetical protein
MPELRAAFLPLLSICEIRTTLRKNHAIPRRFLPKKNAKNSKITTYDASSLRSFQCNIEKLRVLGKTSRTMCPNDK